MSATAQPWAPRLSGRMTVFSCVLSCLSPLRSVSSAHPFSLPPAPIRLCSVSSALYFHFLLSHSPELWWISIFSSYTNAFVLIFIHIFGRLHTPNEARSQNTDAALIHNRVFGTRGIFLRNIAIFLFQISSYFAVSLSKLWLTTAERRYCRHVGASGTNVFVAVFKRPSHTRSENWPLNRGVEPAPRLVLDIF